MKSIIIVILSFFFISSSNNILDKKNASEIIRYKKPKKGVIKGRIINLPNQKKLNNIKFMLTPKLNFDQYLDSLGNFTTREIAYGTYSLKIFKDKTHYPILIKELHINSAVTNLGNLPLCEEPFGYTAEWGELDNEKGKQYYHSFPVYNKQRDSIENIYKRLFKKLTPNKHLTFESINVSTDSSKHISDIWLFSVIKDKQEK